MNQPTQPHQGYGATLLSFGPFSALFFMLHEEVRLGTYGDSWCLIGPIRVCGTVQGVWHEGPWGLLVWTLRAEVGQALVFALRWVHCAHRSVWNFDSGAAAGGVASFLTNPLDVVKLRLQVWQRAVSSLPPAALDVLSPSRCNVV